MQYDNDVFAKFNAAVNDVNRTASDPTILFIATDGEVILKAFAGPASAVDGDYYVSKGFDDNTYMGVWSHDWLREQISHLEFSDDQAQGWSDLMESMVATIIEYVDNTPKDGN